MPDDRRSGDRDWLFHALNDLKDQMKGQHQRIRSDMNAGFDRVTAEVHTAQHRMGTIDDRVIVIETERKIESEQAVKRGAWAGIVAAAGLTGLMQIVRAFWHTGR